MRSRVLSGLYSNLISLEFVGQEWLQTSTVIIKIVIKGNIAVIKFIPRVIALVVSQYLEQNILN